MTRVRALLVPIGTLSILALAASLLFTTGLGQRSSSAGSTPDIGVSTPDIAAAEDAAFTLLDPASDLRLSVCPAATDPEEVLVAIELVRGADYQRAFPAMGDSPELNQIVDPLPMVVYARGYPGPVHYNPRYPVPTQAPGSVDICAILPPSAETIVYDDVPLEGFKPPDPRILDEICHIINDFCDGSRPEPEPTPGG